MCLCVRARTRAYARHGPNVHAPAQSSRVEALTPTVMAFGGGDSGGDEVMRTGPRDGISAPVRKERETRASSLYRGRTQQDGSHLQARRRALTSR